MDGCALMALALGLTDLQSERRLTAAAAAAAAAPGREFVAVKPVKLLNAAV